MRRLSLVLLSLSFTTALFAAEGKWTPQQVLQLDPAWLKQQGLEIEPSRLWDAERGTGLLAATINIGGCSAGFITPTGLFATNHHCLFPVLQEHATPQNDIITNGFIARSRGAELRSKTMRVTVPRRFTDVTAQVVAAVPKNADDTARHKAIERKQTAIVAECEKKPNTRCRVAAHDGGVQYVLQETEELSDVRLVYAPPKSVGDFGGEIDNWMWPRHTGDFAIARVYGSDGQPYRPEFYFPIAERGVGPGDFIMVLGYPGVTYRALIAPEMTERRDLFFTRRRDVYREWIDILETLTRGNQAGTIAVASDLDSLHNAAKNAEGQLSGFKRGSIVENQQRADEAVLAWAKERPEHRAALEAYAGLQAIVEEDRRTWERDYLLARVQSTAGSPTPVGPRALIFPVLIARSAVERAKPDSERDALFQDRVLARVPERTEREQKKLFAPTDRAIFESWVRRALALPAGQRIASIDRLFDDRIEAGVDRRIDDLLARTKVFDLNERLKMLNETAAQLRARKDPLIDLGFELDRELRRLTDANDRRSGAIARLRPVWRRAVYAHAGKPVAPDANSTLRVSFGHVKGYAPRDAVWFGPQTTLSGILQKNNGAEPFNAPVGVLEAARRSPGQPVNFLANADTTGGNSGSPTVNGRGELVGLNFDRVWENVANDFAYNPEIARNVNVDIQYLLWIVKEVDKANELLEEIAAARTP